MSGGPADQERELLRYWVETWQRAGVELEEIRRQEIETADTKKAILQLFGTAGSMDTAPPRMTSGLVEQTSMVCADPIREDPRMRPLLEAARDL